tara:strand:- start:1306 stop:1581 length:276 start_codon:yes stop_codon:yes gene_type:complete
VAKARIGIKLDFDEIGKILDSSELAAVLESEAKSVAQAAGGQDYEVEVTYDRRKSRTISMVKDVSPNGFGREIATGNLARAVSSKEEPWST